MTVHDEGKGWDFRLLLGNLFLFDEVPLHAVVAV